VHVFFYFIKSPMLYAVPNATPTIRM
jgi:hypothetical protein